MSQTGPVLARSGGMAHMRAMSDLPPNALTSPSTARNREPLLQVLQPRLPAAGLVLEIAAGAGEHAAYFAAAFPDLQWRPTDADPRALASIAAWRERAGLANLLPPLQLDAAAPEAWPVAAADAVVCINMIHISPWASTQGLMAGAGRVLPPGGVLVTYGAYLERDVPTAPSNLEFDRYLKARNPAWGLRDRDAVAALAAAHGLTLAERIPMPANNLSLVFRKD
jgi:SAM-dependent methyltransferase